ncbi:hypothetical protein BN1708_012342 [Verticillium longisporum]|uniref:ER membrane protein complex subunit 10 n=1 Tax=Verticillium longisporum TaxID=100787 RepID=A0A0G4L8U2_VERLO|nr:hypothetical protein HYQ44_006195 [Verticillium longisporum]CRK18442.1 hypothetical protein BN1708_012342 [Verticillium longisporum]
MRATALFTALAAAALATASPRIAHLHYQPITPSTADAAAPLPLAEIHYDASTPSSATVASYEAPDLPADADRVRIGAWDAAAGAWRSGVSVTSAATFAKGYAPHLLLSVDASGTLLGAGARGVRIDAGATRDFGPQAVVTVGGAGETPVVNKPVVLVDGRKKEPEAEKTLLQKYWWVIAAVVLLTLVSGDK